MISPDEVTPTRWVAKVRFDPEECLSFIWVSPLAMIDQKLAPGDEVWVTVAAYQGEDDDAPDSSSPPHRTPLLGGGG